MIGSLEYLVEMSLTVKRGLKPLFRIDVVKIYERVPLEKVPRFWYKQLEKQTRDDTRKTADQRTNAWTGS